MWKSLCYLSMILVCLISVGCSQESAAPTAEEPETVEPSETQASTPSPEAEEAVAGVELNVDEQGRAVRGYDAVAYHQNGEAVPGNEAHQHIWQGVTWLFSSSENLDSFAAEPERFAPSNGGYCTFGVVLKKKLDVDPEVFLVENDQLYLFLNREVQERFLGDKAGNLQMVTSQWPEIADKHPDELTSEG